MRRGDAKSTVGLVLGGSTAGGPALRAMFSDSSTAVALKSVIDLVSYLKSGNLDAASKQLGLKLTTASVSQIASALAQSLIVGPAAVVPSVVASLATRAAIQAFIEMSGGDDSVTGRDLRARLGNRRGQDIVTSFTRALIQSYIELQTRRSVVGEVRRSGAFTSLDKASGFEQQLHIESSTYARKLTGYLLQKLGPTLGEGIDTAVLAELLRTAANTLLKEAAGGGEF